MKKLLRLFIILLSLVAGLGLVALGAFALLDRTNGRLVSSGERRRYLVYVPESYDPSRPVPLVISLHGFAEWPAHQMRTSGWNALAEQHGFIVVYPAGTGFPLRWRAYYDYGSDPQKDVTFIAELIDQLSAQYNIDPQRVYANGLSNGAGMSFVLSCMLADRIAAVGLVAGAYSLDWGDCQPARPVPAIIFHGTADPIVPFQGGRAGPFKRPFPAIPEWAAEYARRSGCSEAGRELPGPPTVGGVQYSGCAAGAEVVFYTIEGGGHSWPGGKALPEFIVGSTTQAIDATQLMWAFFEQHPRGALP